ncbi:DnaT-like ssDNA-binding protein [Brevundimonas sp. FT23028]|uniref:DnaT-like ssDNA-binding protein n=1 Tax=Brevundimonas sp. FT23028 TaxID=3393748 RepID=UPI003B5882EA
MAYGSDSGFSDWMAARGHTLPAGAPTPAVLRQRATDYIDAVYGPRLIGDQTVDPLLTALETATYVAAWHEANNPGSLSSAASASGAVKREKVDVLEVEYFEGSGDAAADATVRLTLIEGILAPYLRPVSVAGFGLWAVG